MDGLWRLSGSITSILLRKLSRVAVVMPPELGMHFRVLGRTRGGDSRVTGKAYLLHRVKKVTA